MKTIDEGLAGIAGEVKKLEDEIAKYKDLLKKLSTKNKELEEGLTELVNLKVKFEAMKEAAKNLTGFMV